MDSPLVSVVTVVRNNASDLQGAIASVAGQAYPRVEHVVVDGASTDGTLAVVEAHEGCIARWISEPDSGIYDAINKGLRLATGDLITILNSDDRMQPGAIESVVAVHMENPDVEIIHGDILMEDVDGNPLRRIRSRPWRPLRYFTTPFKHPAMFVTRRCYERLGEYELRYRLAADYEFMLRAMRARVAHKHLPVVLTRVRAVGMTTGTAEISAIDELRSIIAADTGSKWVAEGVLAVRRLHRVLRRRELRRWGLPGAGGSVDRSGPMRDQARSE